MTHEEALAEASKTIEELVRSGDTRIFEAAKRNADGAINMPEMIAAMARATEKLARQILSESTRH